MFLLKPNLSNDEILILPKTVNVVLNNISNCDMTSFRIYILVTINSQREYDTIIIT